MYELRFGSVNRANSIGLIERICGFISLSMFTQQDWLFREA
jgi:hypothetical protein